MFENNEITFSRPAAQNALVIVEQAEQKIQTIIPSPLKNLLLNYNSIRLKKRVIKYVVSESFTGESLLTEIFGSERIFNVINALEDDASFPRTEIIALAETLDSTVVCLGVRPNNYGEVFVFNWDFFFNKGGAFIGGIYQLARTLKI